MQNIERILVYHFTNIQNLESIIEDGLRADNCIHQDLYINSGNINIKNIRKEKLIYKKRYVGDHVPFYFAPRSPMMFYLWCNNYIKNKYIVYIVGDALELSRKYEWCCSNINAAKDNAKFYFSIDDMKNNIDWSIMNCKYWNDTDEFPDRKALRMAEFLVYKKIKFDDLIGLATYDYDVCEYLKNKYGTKIKYIKQKTAWYF